MNRRSHLSGACALALVVLLAVSPVASAKEQAIEPGAGISQRISQIIRKLHKFVGGITAQNDLPTPPRPDDPKAKP